MTAATESRAEPEAPRSATSGTWIAPDWPRWHALAWAALALVVAFAALPPGWYVPCLLFAFACGLPLAPFWAAGLARSAARALGPRRDLRRLGLWSLPLAYALAVLLYARSGLPDRLAWRLVGPGLAALEAEAAALPPGLSELPDRWLFPFELHHVARLPTGKVRAEVSGTAWGATRRGYVWLPAAQRDDPAATEGLEPLAGGWYAWRAER